jgi:cephalosporin hydroxylase
MIYDIEFENERELILKNLKANQKLNLERDAFFQNLVDAKYRIKLIEGDRTDVSTLNKVKSLILKDKKVMIVLDSIHTE